MPEKKQPFYVVWNPRTGYTQHRHSDYQLARQEAQRLARSNKGEEFIVLTPCLNVRVADVIETEYDDDIPF